jgi:DNA-directed RNA polymerase subunit H (RpoH/RPB5)
MADIIPQLLPVEKSLHQQFDIIKINVIKMFNYRGYINNDNVKRYTDELIKKSSDEHEYIINLDNEYNNSLSTNIPSKKIIVKIFDYKITSVNKNSPIGEFITKNNSMYKFIIVDDINQKSEKSIASYQTECEVFKISEMMICCIEHVIVPKHIVLTQEQGKQVLDEYCAKKRDMPFIMSTDPIARYYNMKPGEICKIIRPSNLTCDTPFYRIVIKSKSMKVKT